MDILNKALLKLKRLESEIERLKTMEKGGVITDHGALSGLADDDHSQYLNTTRHDTTTRHTLGTVVPHDDHGALTGLGDDDHPQYVHDTGDETIAGIKTFSSIPELPASNPTTDNQAARKKYVDDEIGDVLQFVPLTTPLTSTSFDGDSFSTTSKTKIDLSAVFSVPAGVRAVLVRIQARDSSSAAYGSAWFGLSPDNTNNIAAVLVRVEGANDTRVSDTGICPCDENGDVYYQINASGAGTLDAWIEIWGYWV